MSDHLPNEDRYQKMTRRQMLRLIGGAGAGILLTACGGSSNQANNTGTQTTTRATGAKPTTSKQLGFENPNKLTTATTQQTDQATQPAQPSGAPSGTTTTGGTTAVAGPSPTMASEPTLPVPTSFKESPQLQQMVKAGKLPKVQERMPKKPAVLKPVEKVGTYGGTWHMGLQGVADTALLIRTIGYENLVRWQPDTRGFTVQEVIPGVAEKVEANTDGTEYTFTLRQGMKWSDGKPFTADDIMFWYEDFLMNKDLTPAVPSWLTSKDKPVTVEKQDDFTVSFKFPSPNGLFLQNLATPFGTGPTSYPQHYMKQFHKKYNKNVVQEAKKQKMDSWTDLFAEKAAPWGNPDLPVLFGWKVTKPLGESTQQVVAERNPYYWKVDTKGNQLPYIDTVQYFVSNNVDTMVLKALNGEIDMQDRSINSLDNKAVFYKNQKKGNYHFYDMPMDQSNVLTFMVNLTLKDENKRKVFQHKDFRVGLSYAINRQEIIDVVLVSQGKPWQAAPLPESPFYNKQLGTQYTEHDVKKANELLDKVLPKKDSSGFRLGPDGKRFSFTVEPSGQSPNELDILQLLKRYFKAVGIDMNVKNESRDLFNERRAGNLLEASTIPGAGGFDVIFAPFPYFAYNVGAQFGVAWAYWFQDPKDKRAVEPPPPAKKQMELYKELEATVDSKQQVDLMKQILDIAQEQFWVMGISLPTKGYGVVKNDFHNVPKEILGSWLYPNPAPTNPPQYYIQK